MPKSTNKSRGDEYDDVDIKFLMAEYDRLKGLAVENDNAQHRRFDFYLVAATAVVAGIISLQQPNLSVAFVERMIARLLLVWLVWGIVAFVNLTYMNVLSNI
jgi:hypothetical protein